MLAEEKLVVKLKKLIEEKLAWGDSKDWTNQDFLELSEKIRDNINESVSHSTLKRIWGKVRNDSLPNMYTLNTLAQFAGYENWRNFKSKNDNDLPTAAITADTSAINHQTEVISIAKTKSKILNRIVFVAGVIFFITIIAIFVYWKKNKIDPADYSFSSKKILTSGVPNSVVFDYDATRAPFDSVIIQQSWDKKLRTIVSKNDHQHTSIYYFPDYYKAKLIVGDQVVKEHDLLIKSDGWLTAVETSPVPVYFKKEDIIADGKMSLSIDKIKSLNINMTPQAPLVLYSNVQDFGEIYSDDFVFETSLRNDYREGSSPCQLTYLYLLCEGTGIGVPLCAKGCESNINFSFTNFIAPGKQKDLSSFGVDFNDFVKLKIESSHGKAKIFLNGKLSYTVDHDIAKSKIIGIDYVFQGTGSVDYVKLSNEKLAFEDEF